MLSILLIFLLVLFIGFIVSVYGLGLKDLIVGFFKWIYNKIKPKSSDDSKTEE